MEFTPFPKIPRLSREMVITEKIDGTNASVTIESIYSGLGSNHSQEFKDAMSQNDAINIGEYYIRAGSRSRFISPNVKGQNQTDNYGFARWVEKHAEELVELGPGTHYGEWWGQGIQRGYGLTEKRFSLFNVGRWRQQEHLTPYQRPVDEALEPAPYCCHVVPVLFKGNFETPFDYQHPQGHSLSAWDACLNELKAGGSQAAPGFMEPEGIIIYHEAARQYFKKTIERDEEWKGQK